MNSSIFKLLAKAFAYPVWTRYRTNYLRWSVPVAFVIVAFHLPVWDLSNRIRGLEQPVAYLILSPLFFVGWVMLVAETYSILPRGLFGVSSAMPDGYKSAGGGPAFPNSIFWLPVTTTTLVVGPMVSAVSVSLLAWTLFSIIDVIPLGLNIPILLPPLMLSAIVASGHAAWWVLRSKPGLGCFLILLVIALPTWEATAWLQHVPLPYHYGVAAIALCVSVFLALWAAPFTRRGSTFLDRDQPAKQRDKRIRASLEDENRPPLVSPVQSKLWFDTKQHLDKIPMFLTFIAGVVLLLRILLSDNDISVPLGIGAIQVGPVTRQFLLLLPISLALSQIGATILTTSSMAQTTANNDPVLSPFLAIRPISSAQIMVARLQLALKSTLNICLVVVASFGVWLVVPAQEAGQLAPISVLLLRHATTQSVLGFILAVLSFVFLIWTFQIGNSLEFPTNNKMLRSLKSFPWLIVAGYVVCLEFVRPLHNLDISAIIPTIAISCLPIVVVKFLLAGFGIVGNRKKNLISWRAIYLGGAIWAGVTLFFFLSFLYVVPRDAIAAINLLLIIVLLMPVNRLLSPILAIDAARHK